MDKPQATNAIKQRMLDLWPGLSTNLPVVFDNEAAPSAPSYARLNIVHTASKQWTLGQDAIFHRYGLIKVKLMSPRDTGTTRPGGADFMVKWVRKIYEGKRFGSTGPGDSGVVCFEASDRDIGVEGEYWVVLVDVSMRYDEPRSSIDA